MQNEMMFIGALGAFFLATAATLVSDMHGVGDWFVSTHQVRKLPLNPAPVYGAPYAIAGWFGEPLLIVSIAMLNVGLVGCWLKFQRGIALAALIVGVLYLVERIFWGFVTVNFARQLKKQSRIQDYSVLKQAGLLKGIGALLGGLVGGFGFSAVLTILFFSLGNPFGLAGGGIILAAMLIGMPAKIYFMSHVKESVLAVFMVSMVIKNFGLVLMGVGILLEALK